MVLLANIDVALKLEKTELSVKFHLTVSVSRDELLLCALDKLQCFLKLSESKNLLNFAEMDFELVEDRMLLQVRFLVIVLYPNVKKFDDFLARL